MSVQMERFVCWWKQNKRYMTLCKALLLALLPVLCCAVTCGVQGKSIGDVYLPCSEWNDELFYYKQVESIVEYGYPLGYYGFNESHALKLSFAAWSPVLVLPWIVWGLLFGWNLMSPIVCNILLMTAAVFLFACLVKPSWKQTGVLALLFCLYTPFVRYMLSVMPEVICFSLLIVFYGLAVNYQRRETAGKLAGLFALSGILTLMRPYMLLFLLLPVFFWIRMARRKGKIWQGLFGSAAVSGAILGCYAMIKHYFGAEYFHPLFFTDWITIFFREGFGAGVHNFFGTLYWKGRDFYAHTVQGIRSGLASGAFFAGYLATLAILLWQSFADWKSLRRQRRSGKKTGAGTEELATRLVTEAHLAFSFVGMLFALLLMYKLTEGSKHLLTFMAAGVFVVALMETRFYKKAVLLGAVFVYLYSYKAVDPYDYQIPFRESGREAQAAYWQEVFADQLELTGENVPNFDNVVIWGLGDTVGEVSRALPWQMMYGLPEGMGISCCTVEYLQENFDALQSRYLLTLSGGSIDRLCGQAGYTELGRDSDIVLYARY